MAFCSNCGKVIPDGTVCDCQGGGSSQFDSNLNNSPLMSDPDSIQPVKKKKKPIVIAIAGVVVLVVLIAFIGSVSGSGYKKPINDLVKGINKCNSQKIISAMVPDDYLEEMKDELDDRDIDWKDYMEEIDDNLEEMMDDLKDDYGKNTKVYVSFLDKKKATKSALKDIKEEYDDEFDAEVTKAYKVKVEIKIKGKDDEKKSKGWLYVVKIKGDGWKIYPDDDESGLTNMIDLW